MSVAEEPRQYLLKMNLPGLDRREVGISVEDGTLRVTDYTPNSLPHGRLMSAIDLPDDVAACSVVADIQDGVLRVRLPRKSPHRSWWRG